jgi:hypothetical protein
MLWPTTSCGLQFQTAQSHTERHSTLSRGARCRYSWLITPSSDAWSGKSPVSSVIVGCPGASRMAMVMPPRRADHLGQMLGSGVQHIAFIRHLPEKIVGIAEPPIGYAHGFMEPQHLLGALLHSHQIPSIESNDHPHRQEPAGVPAALGRIRGQVLCQQAQRLIPPAIEGVGKVGKTVLPRPHLACAQSMADDAFHVTFLVQTAAVDGGDVSAQALAARVGKDAGRVPQQGIGLLEQRFDAAVIPLEQVLVGLRHQQGGPLGHRHIHLTRRKKMPQRFLNQPLTHEPLASTAVQAGQTRRRDMPLEVVHQQLLKQMVVTVPVVCAIERHQKQIGPLQPCQQLDAVPRLRSLGQQHITQGRAEALQPSVR